MDSLDGLDLSKINEVDIPLLLNSLFFPKAYIYLILFSLYQFCMVAHNCHGKTKNLTAKTKYLTAKPKTSRQNKIPYGKTKNLKAKPNTS